MSGAGEDVTCVHPFASRVGDHYVCNTCGVSAGPSIYCEDESGTTDTDPSGCLGPDQQVAR